MMVSLSHDEAVQLNNGIQSLIQKKAELNENFEYALIRNKKKLKDELETISEVQKERIGTYLESIQKLIESEKVEGVIPQERVPAVNEKIKSLEGENSESIKSFNDFMKEKVEINLHQIALSVTKGISTDVMELIFPMIKDPEEN